MSPTDLLIEIIFFSDHIVHSGLRWHGAYHMGWQVDCRILRHSRDLILCTPSCKYSSAWKTTSFLFKFKVFIGINHITRTAMEILILTLLGFNIMWLQVIDSSTAVFHPAVMPGPLITWMDSKDLCPQLNHSKLFDKFISMVPVKYECGWIIHRDIDTKAKMSLT